MANSRTLRRLIKAGVENGTEAFRRAAEELIREERAKKHHLLANDLERMLYGEGPGGPRAPSREYDVPKDTERGLRLLEVRQPCRDLNEIVLSDENTSALGEIILEQGRSELLGSYGLRAVGKVLFYGPPGCGKTTAAEVLATELDMDIAVVRFDSVVSSFLGETAANLRKVFEFLAGERVVALFDEFDAVAKTRSDEAEHGELKRVVNAFLQLVDAYRGRSLLIAATNHESLLDRAIWRRFDEVLHIDRPTLKQIQDLLSLKLRGVRYDLPLDETAFLKAMDGLSHADVERVVVRAIKSMVLAGREILAVDLFETALRKEQRRQDVLARR
jgi:SpoVK/Ycf46/Vps4 family AAA+-type ATPase